MKLIKSVILCFPSIPENFSKWRIIYGNIKIQTLNKIPEKNQECLLISAEKPLKKLPIKTEKGLIQIDNIELKEVEQAIENIANIISLSQKVKRTISSTSPSIFLAPTTKKDKVFLENAAGFDFTTSNRTEQHAQIKFDIEFCLKNLNDRFDGIRIIAEANACDHLSGKFHEYLRFLERAFNRESRGLIVPLTDFLIQNKSMDYSQEEIKEWINARHKSVHANHKDGFFVEGDIRPIVHRIEQACYEVLLNKKTWRDKSSLRRNLFSIECGTIGN
jgi:hypothetical protein